MEEIRVSIENSTGKKLCEATLPAVVPMKILKPELVQSLHEKINLALMDASGHHISYHVFYERREIGPDETLEKAQVRAGDTLDLYSDDLAGAHRG